jgi:hypothetical protein
LAIVIFLFLLVIIVDKFESTAEPVKSLPVDELWTVKQFRLSLSAPHRINGIRKQQVREIAVMMRPRQPPNGICLKILEIACAQEKLQNEAHSFELMKLGPYFD